MTRKIKHKFRVPGLGGIVTTLTGIGVAVLNDPHILSTLAGKVGISVALAGSIVQAVTKAVLRSDAEAEKKAREEG